MNQGKGSDSLDKSSHPDGAAWPGAPDWLQTGGARLGTPPPAVLLAQQCAVTPGSQRSIPRIIRVPHPGSPHFTFSRYPNEGCPPLSILRLWCFYQIISQLVSLSPKR